MKIGIYSPYLDTLGGGERYILTFAEFCLAKNFDVHIFWPEGETIALAINRFNLNLKNLELQPDLYKSFSSQASYFDKIKKNLQLKKYDLIFYLSDGSIPFLTGKQNWIHFQTPFKLNGQTFSNAQKLSKISRVICNSQFTKRFIDQSFQINSQVIYPPVSVRDFTISDNQEKENIILSVGRFDQIQNAKRQDILINTFKKMIDEGLKNWQLVLCGGNSQNQENLNKLRKIAIDYPIDFKINISYQELISLYQKAAIYWHAAGFNSDENKNPQKVEHFGISIVEAMSASCIPMIYKAGGTREIIQDKKNGYFWQTQDQLQKITQNIIEHPEKEVSIKKQALKDSQKYSKEHFFQKLEKLFV